MTSKRRWDSSAVVFIEAESIIAQDANGQVIAEASAGKQDAAVVQAAIDHAHPAGEVKLCAGKYRFEKTVEIYNSAALRGEGRGTVIVPPQDDYALRVQTTDKTTIYRPFHGDPGPLYAVIIADLTIDAADNAARGKGIHAEHFWSSCFQNLWIQNTGNAIYLRHSRESDFSNIYLIANGDEQAKQASVIMTGENNNIHFRGLYVIYPNYIGMELIGTREQGVEVPRLVFISQSMFHGWLRESGAAHYDLIRIADLDAHRVGCLADVVIRDSRITVAGPGHASVNVINSPVTVANNVMTATQGKYVIRASDKARVTVTGNTFHSGSTSGSEYALYAQDCEVIFKDNVLNGANLNVELVAARNSIIADNRFANETPRPTVLIGDDGKTGCRHVEVSGNMFCEKHAPAAVRTSELSTEGINVHDNHFAGQYDGPATDTGKGQ